MTAIRRFYVLPLDTGLSPTQVDQLMTELSDSDRFIPGLLDSFAALDDDSRTVVWEMTFDDEATYTGPYMIHPYHVATLDNFLLGDSPERVAHDFGAARFRVTDDTPRLTAGVRRLVQIRLADDTDASAVEEIAAHGAGMAASRFAADDLAWKSTKGLSWTHSWEQTFADREQLASYLGTTDGIACSTRDGFRLLGVNVAALRILTYEFQLESAPTPPPPPVDSAPMLYTFTARVAPENVETLVRLLEAEYDIALARAGATLVQRWRTIEQGYREVEIQSTWRLDSLETFRDFRTTTTGGHDSNWNRFVLDGMPLVISGTRRFHRPL